MAPFDLRQKAVDFTNQLSDLLNATICDGIRLTASRRNGEVYLVSFNLSAQDQILGKAIPIALRGKPTCFLGLSFRLQPDDEQQYLMVQSSVLALYADQDESVELLHYDYERNKGDGYPEAHLQVEAGSPAWTSFCEQVGLVGRPLKRLHLPVGGRRYRPTVEDLIEFLVVEKLALGRPGWKKAVDAGRADFQRRQLRAAVRRDPASARAVLADLQRQEDAATEAASG